MSVVDFIKLLLLAVAAVVAPVLSWLWWNGFFS